MFFLGFYFIFYSIEVIVLGFRFEGNTLLIRDVRIRVVSSSVIF